MQIDRDRAIPNTHIYDLRRSLMGARLNRFALSLTLAENRAAFKADEDAFMGRFGLTAHETSLVRARDFAGLIEAGVNIYLMLKIGVSTGNGLYHMGAQMRGESYEAFLATRSDKGAV